MSEPTSTIGERLKSARELAGLSQVQVAELLKIRRPSVSEVESGRRDLSADELRRFADIYGVSVSWLLGVDPFSENPSVELAARELSKLNPEDLDRVMNLLKILKRAKGGSG